MSLGFTRSIDGSSRSEPGVGSSEVGSFHTAPTMLSPSPPKPSMGVVWELYLDPNVNRRWHFGLLLEV